MRMIPTRRSRSRRRAIALWRRREGRGEGDVVKQGHVPLADEEDFAPSGLTAGLVID